MNFKLNYKQYSDYINVTSGIFYPTKNFVNQREFNTILYDQTLNKKFFPLPIFFGLKKKQYENIKNKRNLTLKYKSQNVAKVSNLKFYEIDKNLFGKKVFGNNFKKHHYFKIFEKENYKFLSFKISKKYSFKHLPKYFIDPKVFKKKIKKLKFLPSFHTRNVPHNAHLWIHKLLHKRHGGLLIQPLIGQYKAGEYKDRFIMKSNIKASKLLRSDTVFCLPFFSYPRYGGPLEASLHAIVRRNYGCSHFWVGRDHAGYKNFFSKYESQKFCKSLEKKIGIKIISEKEPFYCRIQKIVTNKCKSAKCNKKKIMISGSKIRNLIKKNKKIPSYLMIEDISKLINSKSLIH